MWPLSAFRFLISVVRAVFRMEYGSPVVLGWKRMSSSTLNRRCSCTCPNKFGADSNTNVCPVCPGHAPASLPVANEEALRLTVPDRLAVALQNPRSTPKFDRKNYFYPDVAKKLSSHPVRRPQHTRNGYTRFPNSKALFHALISLARIWKRTSGKISISSAPAAWILTAPACHVAGNRFRSRN